MDFRRYHLGANDSRRKFRGTGPQVPLRHHRFFRRLRPDLSIKKLSSFFPSLIAATSIGVAPRALPMSRLSDPDILAGLFLPFNALALRPPRRATVSPPAGASPAQVKP
jgi:hypothetical protein